MVRPAGPADMAEPPHETDRGTPRRDDALLVPVRRAVRRVRHRTEIQHPDPDPAAGFLPAVPDHVGAV